MEPSINPRCTAYLSKFGDKIAETKVAIPYVGAYGDSQPDPTVNFHQIWKTSLNYRSLRALQCESPTVHLKSACLK